MFRLYPQPSSGLGQQLQFGICTPVDILLAPLGPIKSTVTQIGCCTDAGKKKVDEAIKKALDSLPASDYKSAIQAAGAEAIRSCLCRSQSCGSGPTPGPAKNTALWIAAGAAVLLLGGGLLLRGRRR